MRTSRFHGDDEDLTRRECPACEGAGEVAGDYFADDGMRRCPRCHGDGMVDADDDRGPDLTDDDWRDDAEDEDVYL